MTATANPTTSAAPAAPAAPAHGIRLAMPPGQLPAADAIGQVVDPLERVERGIAGLVGDPATVFEQAPVLGEAGTECSRAGSRQLAQRSLRSELGTASRIPERTIEARAVFEGQALPHAKRLTPSKFNQKARILRERLDPESITERHSRAREARDVRLDSQRDGMALLSQFLPAPDALAIFNRPADAPVSLNSPAEPRTLAQLRADIFNTVMLDRSDDGGSGNDDVRLGSDSNSNSNSSRRSGTNDTGSTVSSDSSAGVGTGGPHARTGNGAGTSTWRPGVAWGGPCPPGTGSIRDRYFGIRPKLSVTVPALVLLGPAESGAATG